MPIPIPADLLERACSAAAVSQAYVHGRQCANGGFCFYRFQYLEEPNLADTYYAVASLRLLGAPLPNRDAIARFVAEARAGGPAALYYATAIFDHLDEEPPAALEMSARGLVIRRPGDDSAESVSRWLAETAQLAWLRRRFRMDAPEAISPLLERWSKGGGYGRHPNLPDTWQAMSALVALNEQPSVETGSFVDSLQAAGVGFRWAPAAAATTIEVLRAGVGCCTALGIPVRFPDDVLRFVLSCQANDGAFARRAPALPDLESTHAALTVIAAVAGSGWPR